MDPSATPRTELHAIAADGTSRQVLSTPQLLELASVELDGQRLTYASAQLAEGAEGSAALYRFASDGTPQVLFSGANIATRPELVQNGFFYFSAAAAVGEPAQLYRSDGTPEGTQPLGRLGGLFGGDDFAVFGFGSQTVVCSQVGGQVLLGLVNPEATAMTNLGAFSSDASCRSYPEAKAFGANLLLNLHQFNTSTPPGDDLLVLLTPSGEARQLDFGGATNPQLLAVGTSQFVVKTSESQWWRSDGSQAGTVAMPAGIGAVYNPLPTFGDKVVSMFNGQLQAYDLNTGNFTLLDATERTCNLVITTRQFSSERAIFNRSCQIDASDPLSYATEYFSTDGTAAGTFPLDPMLIGTFLENLPNGLILPAATGLTYSDGTLSGTLTLINYDPAIFADYPLIGTSSRQLADGRYLIEVSGFKSPMRGQDSSNWPRLLVISDLTAAGTTQIAAGTLAGTGLVAEREGGLLYRNAGQLWRYDLADGTNEAIFDAPINQIIELGDDLLLVESNPASLWRVGALPSLGGATQLVGSAGSPVLLNFAIAAGTAPLAGPLTITLELPADLGYAPSDDGNVLTGTVVLTESAGIAALAQRDFSYRLVADPEANPDAARTLTVRVASSDPEVAPITQAVVVQLNWNQVFLPMILN